MKRVISYLKVYNIFFSLVLLVGGFFLSERVYTWTGGAHTGPLQFGWPSVAGLATVVVTFAGWWWYLRWSRR